MTRQQILDSLNSGKITPELVADWAQDKVPAEQLSQVVGLVVQKGLLPPAMIPDIQTKYHLNRVLSRTGELIMWY